MDVLCLFHQVFLRDAVRRAVHIGLVFRGDLRVCHIQLHAVLDPLGGEHPPHQSQTAHLAEGQIRLVHIALELRGDQHAADVALLCDDAPVAHHLFPLDVVRAGDVGEIRGVAVLVPQLSDAVGKFMGHGIVLGPSLGKGVDPVGGADIRAGVDEHMDVVYKCPFVQTQPLQIGTDRFHLCRPVRITPKADALHPIQGGKAEIGIQLVVLAAQSRLVGYGGHGVHIDPVGKAAVRLQRHQAAKLYPRLLKKLLLLILRVAVAQQQQHQIFPVVPHFLQGVDREPRRL